MVLCYSMLLYATLEVTIYRPNISTLLSSAIITIQIVMMVAYFLTLIYTLSEKRAAN